LEAFSLYDSEDQGLITIDDLKEGLQSLDIYQSNSKDKKLFEALIVHLLIQNRL
jgi:Ca2+-binding EF-hand superfamily protein